MRRRAFLTALGGALALPLTARAQNRIPQIGYLGPSPAEGEAPQFEAFREGLRELGYVEGKTVEIVSRFPQHGTEKIQELAGELVDLKVDIIVSGAQGVYAAHQATKTIPIVSGAVGDLVGLGLAESLGHPGGNVTGLTLFAPKVLVKRLELVKRVKPSMMKFGLLVQKGAFSIPSYLQALQGPAQSMGLTLELIEISDVSEYEAMLAAGQGATIDGLVLTDFPLFSNGAGPGRIAALAIERGVGSAGHIYFARNGGLLGYGFDLRWMFRRTGVFIDKILKGAKPGDIPIEQTTKFETIVNLKTADALGLTMPPDLLAQATEVIE